MNLNLKGLNPKLRFLTGSSSSMSARDVKIDSDSRMMRHHIPSEPLLDSSKESYTYYINYNQTISILALLVINTLACCSVIDCFPCAIANLSIVIVSQSGVLFSSSKLEEKDSSCVTTAIIDLALAAIVNSLAISGIIPGAILSPIYLGATGLKCLFFCQKRVC